MNGYGRVLLLSVLMNRRLALAWAALVTFLRGRQDVKLALVQLARRVLQRGVERALGRQLEDHHEVGRRGDGGEQPHHVRVVLRGRG